MGKQEKKLIPAKTVVKALITGFVSYGILISFIVVACVLVINHFIGSIETANTKLLALTLPLLGGFFLYYLSHTTCRLSTIDLFSKCKTESKNYKDIFGKMNAFFLILTIVVILLANVLLILRITNTEQSIEIASKTYSRDFSPEFTEYLTNKMVADYNEHKTELIVSSIITELALVISFISLIPFQQKLIEQYNESGRRSKPKAEKKKPERLKEE